MILTKLKASSVRGIPRDWPDVQIGQRGLVVYGPSGVGKSSIIDALEFGLAQDSTLFPHNRTGVSWSAAAPHVRTGDPEIAIQVEHDGATHVIAEAVPIETYPPEVREWLAMAQGASFVLRRHMLLRFIDTEPKDRYDLLDPFLKLGSYRLVEQGFKSSIDDLETERGTAEAEINAEDHKLRRIFAVEADAELTEQGLLDQLNVNLAALDLQSCSNIAGVKACQPQIAAGLGGEAMTERFAALGALKTQVQRLGLPDDLKPLVENLRAALVALENERAERTTEILTDLLVRGKEIIEGSSKNPRFGRG